MLEFLSIFFFFFVCCPLTILIFSVSFRFHFGTQRGHGQIIFKMILLYFFYNFVNLSSKQCYISLIKLYYFTSYFEFNLSKMKNSQYIFILYIITEKYDNFYGVFSWKSCTACWHLGEFFISY